MFPQELRRAVYRMASPKDARENFSTSYDCSDEELSEAVAEIVHAVQNMAKKNVGALIVVAPDAVPTHILDSGTELNSHLSSALLECLFNTRAPLHDGAVFIRGNKILAAGCFLPLSQNIDIDRELGTRHRAAIGITENYNVVSVIVSEETGVISTASNGEIIRYYDSSMLTDLLEQVYGLKARSRAKKKRSRRSKA
jgi:diadenylate cyclase